MLYGKEHLRHTYKNKMSTTQKSITYFFFFSFFLLLILPNPGHKTVHQELKRKGDKGKGREGKEMTEDINDNRQRVQKPPF
jgi:hypothetical protein